MRFFYTPRWLQALQPQYVWRIKDAPKTLFLTFDDGPIPEVTPFGYIGGV
jgi:peptidoglycan-N-acetylglucosamine deacetylase